MAVALVTLRSDRGCAAPLVFRGRNPDGSWLDLSGCTASHHIYPAAGGRPASGTPLLARDTGNGKVTIQPSAEVSGAWDILVAFTEADGLALPAGTHHYELIVADSLGEPGKKLYGPWVHAVSGKGLS